MGADADARIVYGFAFEGENFDFDDAAYDCDPEIWLATHQGLPNPDGCWDDNPEAHRAYYEARSTLPIDMVYDGDLQRGQATNYLVIKESRLDGDWCSGTKIPVDHIRTPPPEWDDLLRVFCEKAGVLFQQPEWLLLASYG